MAKYYVESGPKFQYIVAADNFVDALVRAFELSPEDEPLQLADVVIVNERGFVWQREDHQMHGGEVVIPTRLVLGAPEPGTPPVEESSNQPPLN